MNDEPVESWFTASEEAEEPTCETCDGTGMTSGHRCKDCDGKGTYESRQ